MRKFAFSLQSVLDLRISQENMLIAQLAELRRALQLEEQQLAMQQMRFRQAVSEARLLRRELSHTPDVHACSQRHLTVLDDDISEQQEIVQAAQQRVAAKLAEVVEAASKRKTLENLRERHLAAYLELAGVEETKSLDDFASLSAARNRSR